MATEQDRNTKWDVISEIPNLAGRVAIVTGANSITGMGFHIAQSLALKGAKVYVSARSSEKANQAIELMQKNNPSLANSGLLCPLPLELSDLQSVGAVARDFAFQEKRLDILVNNAAVLARPLDKDQNGVSVSFAINHLAPFRFTTALLPLLKSTAEQVPGVRIVNISSTAHTYVPRGVRLASLGDFNQDMGGVDDPQSNLFRYGLSKLANILFTKELQRRFDKENVPAISIAIHPGGVSTDGTKAYLKAISLEPPNDILTPEAGALTGLFAAAYPDLWEKKDQYGGAYLMPFGQLAHTSEDSQSLQLASDLWKASEQVLEDIAA